MSTRAKMKKLQIVILLLITAFGCRKPFTPVLSADNKHYLVIEGTIDGADSTFFRLSRTKDVDTLKTIIPELGAAVTIESDANTTIPLAAIRPGIYAAPPFNLVATQKYRLHVRTSDGLEYESDYVMVKNSPAIDSVGFKANASGVGVYVNAHDNTNLTRYYRWEYTEAWQFHTQYISQYLAPTIGRPTDQQIYACYAADTSSNVVIATTKSLTNDVLFQSPITMVASNSEKVEKRYSIMVKQYALTPDAYAFWQNLQNNTEKLGSIFSVLPSEAPSNYHCVTNPGVLVVGYLSAGSAASKRIYVNASQLPSSYSAQYPVGCELDTTFNNPKTKAQNTMTDIYNGSNGVYTLVEGLYLPPPDPFGHPTAYTYSTNICVDCTIRGTRNAPSFWKP